MLINYVFIIMADPSLRKLVEQILPLSSCYSVVSRFVTNKSKFEHGQVNQALAGAMKLLLNDYMARLIEKRRVVDPESIIFSTRFSSCRFS